MRACAPALAAAVLAALVLMASATQLCIGGVVPLNVTSPSSERDWCSFEGCELAFSLLLDTAAPSARREPFVATLYNGTELSVLFPLMDGVNFQCSVNGDIYATTLTGTNQERTRFIWTYANANSPSCTHTFSVIDLAADFVQFQAMISYSGFISIWDAEFTSDDPAYSLEALQLDLESDECAAATTCTIDDCRYSASKWKNSKQLKTSTAWDSLEGLLFCNIPYRDIILRRGSLVGRMSGNWLADADAVVAAQLNAALYDCPLPRGTLDYLDELLAYLENPNNCNLATQNKDARKQLQDWNDQLDACTDGDIGASGVSSASATCTDKRQNAYMIVMIVFIVITTALLGIAVGAVAWFWPSIQRSLMAMNLSYERPVAQNIASGYTLTREQEMPDEQ